MWSNNYKTVPSKEKVLDALYGNCSMRSRTTKEVVEGIAEELKLELTPAEKDILVEIIKPYKQSGKNLEATLEKTHETISGFNMFRTDYGSTLLANDPGDTDIKLSFKLPEAVKESFYRDFYNTTQSKMMEDSDIIYQNNMHIESSKQKFTEEELDF